MVATPDFERAKNYALGSLERGLSPNLTYHCLAHTQNEVVPAATQLATLEKVAEKDCLLLLTGAYFHDLGFIQQRQGHEQISIQLAEQSLPAFGYSDSDIEVITGIIRVTHLPQTPTTLLEKIMADADLDDLGNFNFWKRSHDLRQELTFYEGAFTDEEWFFYQLRLMNSHTYFTASERALRGEAKQQHKLEVEQLLKQTQLNKTLKQS